MGDEEIIVEAGHIWSVHGAKYLIIKGRDNMFEAVYFNIFNCNPVLSYYTVEEITKQGRLIARQHEIVTGSLEEKRKPWEE